MASLSNKNKRRGFKDALTRGIPPKITFADGEPNPNSSSAGQGSANAMQVDADADALVVETSVHEAPRRTQQARLIPPSEKQELGLLPPNMFVTSVDVEEGMWPRRKNKKKKKKQEAEETWDQEVDETFAGDLPYDDESAQAAYPAAQGTVADESKASVTNGETMERLAIAAHWDSLRKITDRSQVSVGTTVAWKVCVLRERSPQRTLTLAHRHWGSTSRLSHRKCCYTSHAFCSPAISSSSNQWPNTVQVRYRSAARSPKRKAGQWRRPSNGLMSYRATGGW